VFWTCHLTVSLWKTFSMQPNHTSQICLPCHLLFFCCTFSFFKQVSGIFLSLALLIGAIPDITGQYFSFSPWSHSLPGALVIFIAIEHVRGSRVFLYIFFVHKVTAQNVETELKCCTVLQFVHWVKVMKMIAFIVVCLLCTWFCVIALGGDACCRHSRME